ncbi:hypothetical protein [Paenibacillus sp. YSY-4.3]
MANLKAINDVPLRWQAQVQEFLNSDAL